MKKLICTALASLMLLSAVSCGAAVNDTAVASTASAAEQILIDRLGGVPENVILGDATVAAEYGIDMTSFEDDGYVLRTMGDITLVFGKTEDGLDRAVRAYTKAVREENTDTLDVVYHEGARIERLTIAGRDISEYTVYYPETANANMEFAVSELVRLVEIATGVTLPVVVGAPVSPAIEFRHTDDPALETDGYRYEVTSDGLVIEGAVDRGCMNGVWRFLQLECGWDFLIYGNSHLKEADHIDIPAGTEHSEEPAFESLWLENWYEDFENDCTVPTSEQNSYGALQYYGHGIFEFYNAKNHNNQPCYTSEEFYEETYYNIEKYVSARYGNPGFRQVSIGQNDTTSYCMCETCSKVFVEEGGNAGAVVRYANRISEDINKDYPGIYFCILAYAGSNAPPQKTIPGEYVFVSFATDWKCDNHKMDGTDCKDTVYFYDRNNSTYAEWLEGWCAIATNVCIRGYNLSSQLDEYTVIDTVYDDYKYFHELGVSAICIEGSDFGNWGLKRIEQMMIAELNWNMDMTREEFTEIYHTVLAYEYGEGWEYVLEYIDDWVKAQDMVQCWAQWGISPSNQTSRYYNTGYFAKHLDSYVELIDAAISVAESARQEEMLKRLSASVLYKGCYSSYFMAWLENDTERIAELSALYDRCMNTLRELGIDPTYHKFSEWSMPLAFGNTIEEEAWTETKWALYFYVITGQELPEDAPVIIPEDKLSTN